MYQVTARNFSSEHENKIHSDEVAQRFGFSGALVPGVAVWGHLTHPLVAEFGADWLQSAHAAVRFHKPAYDDELLSIECSVEESMAESRAQTSARRVTCRNPGGELLAEVHSPLGEVSRHLVDTPRMDSFATAPVKNPERVPMNWESVEPGEQFSAWSVELTSDENRRWTDEVQDELALYHGEGAAVHPHWLLGVANRALTREYEMPAWIHVGSEIRFHHLLAVGDEIVVRTLVEEKWERKGHQFLRTYGIYQRGDEVTTEVSHTAIFRVAG